MARIYQVLSQAEQDDMILQTVYGLEASHAAHAVNIARYTAMLPTIPDTLLLPSGQLFRDRIAELLKTEQAALDQHEHLLDQAVPQLPKGQDLLDAKARFTARQGKV